MKAEYVSNTYIVKEYKSRFYLAKEGWFGMMERYLYLLTTMTYDEIAIYQAPNGAIELRADADRDTIWANQKQMAEIFDISIPAINQHVKNIYKDAELGQDGTIKKILIVAKEGKRSIERSVEHYNLDVIISVGYRVNSKKATQFRQRATQTLKQHITQGYTINPQRLQYNYDNSLHAIEEIKHFVQHSDITPHDVAELIQSFSHTWLSLDAYDKSDIPDSGYTSDTVHLHAQQLYQDIALLKEELTKKGEATDLFAQEKYAGSLEGIFGNVVQSVFGNDVYPTIEEKAAHLLYFVIKNHPFNDGNKRSGAFSFVRFLQKSGLSFRDKITPEALTAITLLIAQSDSKDKDRLVGLVILLLKKSDSLA